MKKYNKQINDFLNAIDKYKKDPFNPVQIEKCNILLADVMPYIYTHDDPYLIGVVCEFQFDKMNNFDVLHDFLLFQSILMHIEEVPDSIYQQTGLDDIDPYFRKVDYFLPKITELYLEMHKEQVDNKIAVMEPVCLYLNDRYLEVDEDDEELIQHIVETSYAFAQLGLSYDPENVTFARTFIDAQEILETPVLDHYMEKLLDVILYGDDELDPPDIIKYGFSRIIFMTEKEMQTQEGHALLELVQENVDKVLEDIPDDEFALQLKEMLNDIAGSIDDNGPNFLS